MLSAARRSIPPGAQAHPLAVAEEPRQPLRETTSRTVRFDAPLRAAGHRPGAALARRLPSLLRPAGRLRSRILAALVLRRETFPPATDQRLRRPGREPLGRHHRLAQKPTEQWPARRDQLPGPGRQIPRPRLPQQAEHDHHHLPHRSQTPPTEHHQPHPHLHARHRLTIQIRQG